MAAEKVMLLLFMLLLCCLAASDTLEVFSKLRKSVTLKCHPKMPDCRAIWYGPDAQRIKLQTEGLDRSARLSMLDDCSLSISNISFEDAGLYVCQQRDRNSSVALYVLGVTESLPMAGGSKVILNCSLHHPQMCNERGHNLFLVSWVSKTDEDLQGKARFQVHSSSCYSTLSTSLQRKNQKQRLKCRVAVRQDVKTSIFHTITISDPDKSPVGIIISVCICTCVAAVLTALVAFIWKRRKAIASAIHQDIVHGEDTVVYAVVNFSPQRDK